MSLDISVTSQGSWQIVSVKGEVDLATASTLERSLGEQGTSDVIADLTEVSFMDSTGLRVLISAQQQVEAAGWRFAVVPGTGPVSRLLGLTGVDERLDTFDSVHAATSS